MRRKRITISTQNDLQDPTQRPDQRILQERNTNLFQMINSALTKASNRNYFTKKSVVQKLKQAQREHCCIDIVNRRSLASSTQNKRSSNATNIDDLKRQINYLERDELKWDKFPKESQEKQNEFDQPQTPVQNHQFQMHFLNKIQEGTQPMILKGFRNTFKSNFNASDQQRPLTTNEKRAFQYIAQERKKSLKKYGTLQQEETSERSAISRTIHSQLAVSSPFRRYVRNCRRQRNQSCTVNLDGLEGRQYGKRISFLGEEPNFD